MPTSRLCKAERPVIALDGKDRQPDGLVFVTKAGYAVNGSWLTKHFQSLLEAAKLPKMRLHDMRHGAASRAVLNGESAVRESRRESRPRVHFAPEVPSPWLHGPRGAVC